MAIDVEFLQNIDREVEAAGFDGFQQLIITHWRHSIQHVLTVCRALFVMRRHLGERSESWKDIVLRLPFNRGSINKLCRIGGDDRLYDTDLTARMPPHWGTLYEISSLSDKALYGAIGERVITPEVSRAEIVAYKVEKGESRNAASKQVYVRDEWVREYIARTAFIMDIPSTVALRDAGPDSPRAKGRDPVHPAPSFKTYYEDLRQNRYWIRNIEKAIDARTDVLFTVKISKMANEEAVEQALHKMMELASISGIVPLRVNQTAVRRSVTNSIERLLILLDSLFERAVSGDMSAVDLMMTDKLIAEADRFSISHDLLRCVDFYTNQLSGGGSGLTLNMAAELDSSFLWLKSFEAFRSWWGRNLGHRFVPPDDGLIGQWAFGSKQRAGLNPMPELTVDQGERLNWAKFREDVFANKFDDVFERMSSGSTRTWEEEDDGSGPRPEDFNPLPGHVDTESDAATRALRLEMRARKDAKDTFLEQFRKKDE